MGMMIQFDVNALPARAYLALPDSMKGPGVLLMHAWWGLNPFFKNLSDRLAGEGFVVMAPDYYHGAIAENIDQAQALSSKVDRKATNKLLNGSLEVLCSQSQVLSSQVGVIGFSLGCGFALILARSKPNNVVAVVLYYGTGGGKYQGVNAHFLGHFAEHDEWGAHSQKVSALKDRLSQANGEVKFYTYPGTGHWFCEEDRRGAYDKQAAEKAWERTIGFLHANLG
jgi:carboxymethylenebutenolidase